MALLDVSWFEKYVWFVRVWLVLILSFKQRWRGKVLSEKLWFDATLKHFAIEFIWKGCSRNQTSPQSQLNGFPSIYRTPLDKKFSLNTFVVKVNNKFLLKLRKRSLGRYWKVDIEMWSNWFCHKSKLVRLFKPTNVKTSRLFKVLSSSLSEASLGRRIKALFIMRDRLFEERSSTFKLDMFLKQSREITLILFLLKYREYMFFKVTNIPEHISCIWLSSKYKYLISAFWDAIGSMKWMLLFFKLRIDKDICLYQNVSAMVRFPKEHWDKSMLKSCGNAEVRGQLFNKGFLFNLRCRSEDFTALNPSSSIVCSWLPVKISSVREDKFKKLPFLIMLILLKLRSSFCSLCRIAKASVGTSSRRLRERLSSLRLVWSSWKAWGLIVKMERYLRDKCSIWK